MSVDQQLATADATPEFMLCKLKQFYDSVSDCNAVWSAKSILIKPLHVQIHGYMLQASDRPQHSNVNNAD